MDGIKLHYNEHGDPSAPPLVLLGGYYTLAPRVGVLFYSVPTIPLLGTLMAHL